LEERLSGQRKGLSTKELYLLTAIPQKELGLVLSKTNFTLGYMPDNHVIFMHPDNSP